jgi:hypothetical protein
MDIIETSPAVYKYFMIAYKITCHSPIKVFLFSFEIGCGLTF